MGCAKEKDGLAHTISQLNIKIQELNVIISKQTIRINMCEKEDVTKKYKKCLNDYNELNKINITIKKEITVIKKTVFECSSKKKALDLRIIQLELNIKNCKGDLEICKKDGGKKECDIKITNITQEFTIKIKNWETKYHQCEKDNYECNDNKKNFLL